jgi:alcohol dehydrogenase (cytochrome c)
MAKRYELSDAQWRRSAPLLPGKKGDPGRTAKDNRLFVHACLWVLRSGAHWHDLPERYVKWRSVHKRFGRWADKGVWERVFAALIDDPDNEYVRRRRPPRAPRPPQSRHGVNSPARELVVGSQVARFTGDIHGTRPMTGRHRMKQLSGVVLALMLGACATGLTTPSSNAPANPQDRLRPVSSAELKSPRSGDWLLWGRTYDGQNFSPLKSINRVNVARLAPAWRVPLQPGLSMPSPLVHDGVMFLHTAPDTILALDAANGRELWRHVHKPAGASSMKMGLGLGGGRVFAPTSDLHVIALDARTGETAWNHKIELSAPATNRAVFNLRSAPLVVGDKVIQGVTASMGPGGGFIVALDIATGKEVWRFHTIARPGEPGGNTWNDLPLEKRTGGSVWDQGTYDPDLNLIYFGAGATYDTGPLRHASTTPGVSNDALFTNATMAIDADTGKLRWHYQHLRNDQWDLDWAFERTLATMQVNGRKQRVVMTVGKMGILDALDPATGAYLFSIDAGTQNMITAIDPKTGEKTIDPMKLPDPSRSFVYCPSPSGARAWPASSFSPPTGLLVLPLTEWCQQMGPEGSPLLTAAGARLSEADHPDAINDKKMGRLQAMDVSGRRLAWRHDLTAPISTSALATAGGVVFAGDLDPSLKAFDDRNGDLLWTAPLEGAPSSMVVTYAVGRTQYVAVVTGFSNFHIGAMAARYAKFRAAVGLPPLPAPKPGAAIQVFQLK